MELYKIVKQSAKTAYEYSLPVYGNGRRIPDTISQCKVYWCVEVSACVLGERDIIRGVPLPLSTRLISYHCQLKFFVCKHHNNIL